MGLQKKGQEKDVAKGGKQPTKMWGGRFAEKTATAVEA